MENRGQYVRKKIKSQGFTIGQVAEEINKTPTTLSNYFKNPELPWKAMQTIGEAIGYQFETDYPSLAAASISKPVTKKLKKRGRKPGSKNKNASLNRMGSLEPKKRGRKPKTVELTTNNIDWHTRYNVLKVEHDKLTKKYISMLEKLAKVEGY